MEYVKPSLLVLGHGSALFKWINGKLARPNLDGSPFYATPAYDLDE
jgi:hypothetical protein